MCRDVQCNNKVADRINPKAQSLPKSKCLWAYAGDVNGFTKAAEEKISASLYSRHVQVVFPWFSFSELYWL